MENLNYKVRYSWTEDGIIENCDVSKTKSDIEEQCYHCNRKIKKGIDFFILTASDQDTYNICSDCFKKIIL